MGKTMKRMEPQIIELDAEALHDMVRRAEAKQFQDEDYETVKVLAQSYVYLTDLLKEKNLSVRRLRKMLFGASTEKTEAVLGNGPDSEIPASDGDAEQTEVAEETDSGADSAPQNDAATRPKGHGRNGVDAYEGAKQEEVPHPSLDPGDSCPECGQGTVYETSRPGVLIRFTGQVPVQATVYKLQKLRCNLCGKIFTAPAPDGVENSEKYDTTVGSMIGLLKYGSGLPFNRLQRLQGSLGIPLAASTQWDIVHAKARLIWPAYAELIRQAAQGDVVYNDDTTIKILELMGKRAARTALDESSVEGSGTDLASGRRGIFTSGIVSTTEGRKIAVFFSGRQHAGENLADVLAQRAQTLPPPIQMCDALSRNLPKELETIVANCLSHGRRQFVDLAESFPQECRYVLETLAVIYKNDAVARERNLSPEARLDYHQTESGPIMADLHAWLIRQFDDRLVEPNSTLGGVISYLLKHWEKLTLFLRKAGAPLDNNLCERALKKAILHRKNSLFFKTANGAHVGDQYMSLIYTCELCEADPFDYLNELERHARELSSNPECWMPWNYREMLTTATAPAQTAG
jgi:transposase